MAMGTGTKIALGFAGLIGLMLAFGKSVGDEVKPFDLVLVPVKRFPTNASVPVAIRQKLDALKQSPDFASRIDELSIAVRADTVGPDIIAGPVVGLFRKSGDTVERAETLTEELPATTIPKSAIVGIFKRGLPVADTGNKLEAGAFA